MWTLRLIAIVMFTSSIAAADPDPIVTPTFTLQTTLFLEKTPTPVPSLRIEASRLAQERYDGQWRYPEPNTLGSYDGTGIFFGAGHYRPRSARSAALHGASMGATLLGEILLATGSPLAGVAAFATGATLDAAAADSDRDAEAARPR
ncbi:MAG: hypothetical protein M4D80_20830 [Myxococcota bacterium]|nr:hypothetical protein [Deltaproteobacteria bacterium]MDQ3337614.1 hypothetical protein [Myxococcota bacterium]